MKLKSQDFLKLLLDRSYKFTTNVSVSRILKGKIILITGAGGSIGSEICRQLIKYQPYKLILVGHGENSIYQIQKELRSKTSILLETEIVEIQNRKQVQRLLQANKPDFVFHAAAHKHVPLMQKNPHSAIENNLIGTINLAEASGENGVDHFILVSTDKAVNPTTVMGATKKLAEKSLLYMKNQYSTNYAVVRFGNVLASNGSVIPLFMEQIKSGGPLTITDPDMTRYFMSIEEAAELVIKANCYISEGNIFILNMGPSIKIINIAEKLVWRFAKQKIDYLFTGIRPGEKLHEELLEDEENNDIKNVDGMLISEGSTFPFFKIVELLEMYQKMGRIELSQCLIRLVNQKETIYMEG